MVYRVHFLVNVFNDDTAHFVHGQMIGEFHVFLSAFQYVRIILKDVTHQSFRGCNGQTSPGEMSPCSLSTVHCPLRQPPAGTLPLLYIEIRRLKSDNAIHHGITLLCNACRYKMVITFDRMQILWQVTDISVLAPILSLKLGFNWI